MPSSPPGFGTAYIQSTGDNCIDNPSSKANLNATTDLVVMAGADCSDSHFHGMSDLAAPWSRGKLRSLSIRSSMRL